MSDAAAGTGRVAAGFERSRIAAAVIGLDGRFVRVNDALCRLLGRPRSQLLGLALDEVLHPDERTAARDGYRRLAEGELDRVQATRGCLRGDGSVVPVSLSAVAVRDAAGSLTHAFGQFVDIREQHRAERRLSRHAKRTRSLLELWDQLAAASPDQAELLQEAPRAVACDLGDAAVLWWLQPEQPGIVPGGWYDAHPQGLQLLDELHDEPRPSPGEGVLGRVWATGEPLLAAGPGVAELEPQLPSAYRLWLLRFGASSIVFVPLRLRGEVTGVLGVARRAGRQPFADDDLRVLLEIADRLALTLDHARLFAAAEAAATRQAVLVRAGDELARTALDLDGVVEAVVTTAADGLGDPCVLRLLRDDDPSRFGRTVIHHPDPDAAALLRRHFASASDAADRGLAGAVMRAGPLHPPVVRVGSFDAGVTPALAEYLGRYGIACAVGAQLRVRGQAIGVIVVGRSAGTGAFSADDVTLVQALADRAAVAIDNARLFRAVRDSERELRRAAERRRELLTHLVAAQEKERRRIAEDVHDDSIQVMAAVDLRLAVLRRRLAGLGACEEVETLDKLQHAVREATGRLRTLLFDLQPPQLDHGGLLPAIRQFAETVFEGTDTEVEVRGRFSSEPEADLQMLLYRIGQEALVNARKHAHARSVSVFGAEVAEGYQLVVRDDGSGLDHEDLRPRHGHLGVITMRERAELAEGTLEVCSSPGDGTTVRVWVPASGGPRRGVAQHAGGG